MDHFLEIEEMKENISELAASTRDLRKRVEKLETENTQLRAEHAAAVTGWSESVDRIARALGIDPGGPRVSVELDIEEAIGKLRDELAASGCEPKDAT